MDRVLINITGPTASGKTALAIALAKALKTGIISADSRQVYKEMRIGTAVPTMAERDGIPHYLLQHRSIHDTYTVKDFEREALDIVNQLFAHHPVVIVAGGTGLYFNALNYGLDPVPDIPPQVRHRLENQWQNDGLEPLLDELRRTDPRYFDQVDKRNPRRVLRALEVIRHTGKPFSAFRTGAKRQRPFKSLWIGLDAPRPELYERIRRRTHAMIAAGLEDEVRRLYPYRHLNALQTVGYREWFPYFEGRIPRETVIEEIVKNTRRYAKRQLTWFRRNDQIRWWDITRQTPAKLAEDVLTHIKENL